MSEPTTRPTALERAVRDETEFRIAVLTSQARIEEWIDGHDKRDDERFADHGRRLDDLEDKTEGVSSSYSEGRGVREFLKDILPWLVALGAIAGWLWEHKP